MANRSMISFLNFVLAVLLLLLPLLCSSIAAAAEIRYEQKPCNGSIADCYEEEELLMESEISRRILAQSDPVTDISKVNNDNPCGKQSNGRPYKSCVGPKNGVRPCTQGNGCDRIYAGS
uniref:Rapid alkalinization factor-like n=1 Tax=Nelumbo nucifera TaxID=4432 RepID=A0A822XZA0_NELNU|nr:TPA_asm: hypothetical protein HUJ06_025598 [Nelumbo nucifera]